MIIVIANEGVDPRLLQLDLAGRAFGQYLSSNLRSFQAGDGSVLELDDSRQEQLRVIRGYVEAASDLLAFQADVWFSKEALARLEELVTRESGVPRIVREHRSAIDLGRTRDILAIYLPAGVAKQMLDRLNADALWSGLLQYMDILSNYAITDSLELDCALPPMRVVTLLDLAALERNMLYERACKAILSGVRIRDPRQVSIRGELRCGARVEIDLNVIIEGRVELAEDVRIGANSIIANSKIGPNTRINPFSIVEDSVIGSDSFVGPYGRIRPGSVIGSFVQIGNFVEIKNSEVGSGSRVNHLSFVGDASLGSEVTIGAGTITCNHNGVGISRTQIRAGAYVGSGTQLVAPILVGENATIGAGSTITRDAPAGKLTVGIVRQRTIDNWARPIKKSPIK